jgi:hypothetical protein
MHMLRDITHLSWKQKPTISCPSPCLASWSVSHLVLRAAADSLYCVTGSSAKSLLGFHAKVDTSCRFMSFGNSSQLSAAYILSTWSWLQHQQATLIRKQQKAAACWMNCLLELRLFHVFGSDSNFRTLVLILHLGTDILGVAWSFRGRVSSQFLWWSKITKPLHIYHEALYVGERTIVI